jgi:Uma2 family endonuclease
VEVLSKGNTRQEMARKLKEYFLAGVLLVWYVDPKRRTVTVYTAPDQSVVRSEEETLDGGDVIPGFKLPLRKLFAQVPRTPGKGAKKRRPNGRQKNGHR